jgi:dipeptidyl aminopeptidase/acylaminoacyl peptidase
LEGVSASTGTGGAQYAVSANGTLVYLPGPADGNLATIVWMDQSGHETSLRPTPDKWSNPHFSSDGDRLAFDLIATGLPDVWVYDWVRNASTRLTSDDGVDLKPVWTPDARRIVFGSSRDNSVEKTNLYWQRADGTGEVQRLTNSGHSQLPGSWHPSGKFLAFFETTPTGPDIMILPMEGDEASGWKPGTPTAFLATSFNELEPMFSPDGRWLAYISAESGRQEIYVRPFPARPGKWAVSTGGGAYPTWSRARPELLYLNPMTRQIMAVSFTTAGDAFVPGKPRLWSASRIAVRPRLRSFDLHPDGDRVAVATAAEDNGTAAKQDKVVFIFNFFDELRRVAPIGN